MLSREERSQYNNYIVGPGFRTLLARGGNGSMALWRYAEIGANHGSGGLERAILLEFLFGCREGVCGLMCIWHTLCDDGPTPGAVKAMSEGLKAYLYCNTVLFVSACGTSAAQYCVDCSRENVISAGHGCYYTYLNTRQPSLTSLSGYRKVRPGCQSLPPCISMLRPLRSVSFTVYGGSSALIISYDASWLMTCDDECGEMVRMACQLTGCVVTNALGFRG